jgi:two-component system, NarL family, nitrate/nitrite response regulator NarL
MSAEPVANLGRSASIPALIIDDQAAVQRGLTQLLEAAGGAIAPIHVAGDVREARLQMVLRQPRLVLLDVDLGGEDGLALLPELTPHARVVVLTSQLTDSVRARAARLGARDTLSKHESAFFLLDRICQVASTPDSREE